MSGHSRRAALLAGPILLALTAVHPGAGGASEATPAPVGTAAALSPAACGDGMLARDESCDSCPADCQAATCKTKGRRTVTVFLIPQSGYDKVGAVTVLLGYRKGVLSLPGEKDAPAVKARVKARDPKTQVFVNDLGYALRVVLSSSDGMPAGPLVDLDLDACDSAPAAQVGDLSCRVESCAQGGGRLTACKCSVSLP